MERPKYTPCLFCEQELCLKRPSKKRQTVYPKEWPEVLKKNPGANPTCYRDALKERAELAEQQKQQAVTRRQQQLAACLPTAQPHQTLDAEARVGDLQAEAATAGLLVEPGLRSRSSTAAAGGSGSAGVACSAPSGSKGRGAAAAGGCCYGPPSMCPAEPHGAPGGAGSTLGCITRSLPCNARMARQAPHLSPPGATPSASSSAPAPAPPPRRHHQPQPPAMPPAPAPRPPPPPRQAPHPCTQGGRSLAPK